MNDSDITIIVKNLSKCYRIGIKENLHDTFGATVFNFLRSPVNNFRKYRSLYRFDDYSFEKDEKKNPSDIIWALKNISFEIKKGEVVGIIGINGAGKSTLLKVLSKITVPNEGHAEIRGRISSLLEVGTGFHPELTGRENIYLNGTILGMKKKEIDEKFDAIVDFSGVEKFIDTPVKRFSSGMKVRLAFSVAAHLDPEILIIDEVLAVGDAAFQKKCMKKMEDVGQYGRTVLFVSHNMQAITRLCSRAILLNEGQLIADGPSSEIVSSYLSSGTGTTAECLWDDANKAPGKDIAKLRAVRIRTDDGHITESIDIRKPIEVEMEFEVLKGGYVLMPIFNFFNEEGIHVFFTLDQDPNWRRKKRPEGIYKSVVKIPGNFLSEGMVFVTPCLYLSAQSALEFKVTDAVSFFVVDSQDGNSARGDWTKRIGGAVRPLLKWETHYNPTN
jgi:lipopolysaccharide transport system ATP-binding protein